MNYQVYRWLMFIFALHFAAPAIFGCEKDEIANEDCSQEEQENGQNDVTPPRSSNIFSRCLPHLGTATKFGLLCYFVANVPQIATAAELALNETCPMNSRPEVTLQEIFDALRPILAPLLPPNFLNFPNFDYGRLPYAPANGWNLPTGYLPPVGH